MKHRSEHHTPFAWQYHIQAYPRQASHLLPSPWERIQAPNAGAVLASEWYEQSHHARCTIAFVQRKETWPYKREPEAYIVASACIQRSAWKQQIFAQAGMHHFYTEQISSKEDPFRGRRTGTSVIHCCGALVLGRGRVLHSSDSLRVQRMTSAQRDHYSIVGGRAHTMA